MMRMGEWFCLLIRRIIGIERFVACHQGIQHLEHHFRRRNGVITTGRSVDINVGNVRVCVYYYTRRLPRRPRRTDAHDARRDVAFDCSRRRRWSLPDGVSAARRACIRATIPIVTLRLCKCYSRVCILFVPLSTMILSSLSSHTFSHSEIARSPVAHISKNSTGGFIKFLQNSTKENSINSILYNASTSHIHFLSLSFFSCKEICI